MRSATRGLYVKYNRELENRSGSEYLRFLRILVQEHLSSDSVSPECHHIDRQVSQILRTPVGKTIDWEALLTLAGSLSKQQYSTPIMHFWANQWSLLIRKYPKLPIRDLDPEQQAIDTFLSSEARCFETNKRFENLSEMSVDTIRALHSARGWIAYVIGNRPPVGDILDKCDFTPGASIDVHGNATNIARKLLCETWSCTPSARSYALSAISRNAQLVEYLLDTGLEGPVCLDPNIFSGLVASKIKGVHYNKITFVPKTAKTHRSIAVEPLLNSFLQKGVDSWLKFRLKRVGLPLDNQERNAQFARKGSLKHAVEEFATIDLSSASDSVSTELVRFLLPEEWFNFLDALRSKFYRLSGELGCSRFQKFCSMGNGFNFPLQTLIYASLIQSLDKQVRFGINAGVYGDDIAVHPTLARNLIPILQECGFVINLDKTFIEGPFRESCGADWFEGVDVRPYTLDFELDSIEAIFKVLNGTRRSPLTTEFFASLSLDTFKVPRELRYVRPFPGPDDTAVTVPFDVFQTSPYARFNRSLWCWSWKELQHTPVDDVAAVRHDMYKHAVLYDAYRTSPQPYSWTDSAVRQLRKGRKGVSTRPVHVFTLRRKTSTKEVISTSGGTQSTWLPSTR